MLARIEQRTIPARRQEATLINRSQRPLNIGPYGVVPTSRPTEGGGRAGLAQEGQRRRCDAAGRQLYARTRKYIDNLKIFSILTSCPVCEKATGYSRAGREVTDLSPPSKRGLNCLACSADIGVVLRAGLYCAKGLIGNWSLIGPYWGFEAGFADCSPDLSGPKNPFILAEREGFEPSVPREEYARLAIWCLRPLGHLSAPA